MQKIHHDSSVTSRRTMTSLQGMLTWAACFARPDGYFSFHNIFATWRNNQNALMCFVLFFHCCSRAKPPRPPPIRQNFQLVSCDLATNVPPPSRFWRNQKVNSARCLSNPKEMNPEGTVIPPNAGNINAHVASGGSTSDFVLPNFR